MIIASKRSLIKAEKVHYTNNDRYVYNEIMGIKKSILFGLVLIDEILREFRDPLGFVSFSYKNLYGFVPASYKRRNLYNIVYSLKRNGELDFLKDKNFRLTHKGKDLISDYFPKIRFLHKPWDGKWRIVGFDIEEKRRSLRDNFRNILYRHGFRMVQKSLYISPLPLEKEIEKMLILNKDLLQNAYIFVSDKFFIEDKEDLIEKVFKLDLLNGQYKELLEKIDKGPKEEKSRVLEEFLNISLNDPFLPKELLPKNFLRDKLWSKLQKEGIISLK